jgi:hypothetical protein
MTVVIRGAEFEKNIVKNLLCKLIKLQQKMFDLMA